MNPLRSLSNAPRIAFILGLIAASAVAAEPSQVLVKREAKRIHATLAFTLDAPDIEASEWIVFVPHPPVLPSQRAIKASFEPGGVDYRELSDRHRLLFRSRYLTHGKTHLKQFVGKAEFDATLIARKLVAREPGKEYGAVDVLTPESRAFNTASSAMYDFRSEAFVDWLEEEELVRRKKESELHFARRAFLAVKDSFAYEYELKMDRQASHVCRAGKSDCGGLSILYAAVMRANGLPARALAGCWAKSSKPGVMLGGVQYNQVHVKAEVYLQDIGWVPVDLASAINHDKSPEGLQYFGNDAGDFLTMHVDPELKVDTVYFGEKTFAWLQQYHWYVAGKGKLTNTDYKIEWTVETK